MDSKLSREENPRFICTDNSLEFMFKLAKS